MTSVVTLRPDDDENSFSTICRKQFLWKKKHFYFNMCGLVKFFKWPVFTVVTKFVVGLSGSLLLFSVFDETFSKPDYDSVMNTIMASRL